MPPKSHTTRKTTKKQATNTNTGPFAEITFQLGGKFDVPFSISSFITLALEQCPHPHPPMMIQVQQLQIYMQEICVHMNQRYGDALC